MERYFEQPEEEKKPGTNLPHDSIFLDFFLIVVTLKIAIQSITIKSE